MCSTPRSASRKTTARIHSDSNRIEYEEYAQMLRNASECYERNQQKKAAARKAKAIDKPS